MSKSVKRVEAALANAGVSTEVRQMSGQTRTAAEAASELGCEVDQIAKSIIFQAGDSEQAVLFITAGGNVVDKTKAQTIADTPLLRADAAFVRRVTGFAIGGVAPVGHVSQPVSFFDPRLFDFDIVYAAGGTPNHIFAISPDDLLRASSSYMSEFTS